jgi:membrane protein DedA with SNARE-associated domain
MDPLVLASLTDPLVRFATNVVGDLGLGGIFVLMLLESACIPIPSEATMLFAGFNVSTGHYSLLTITVAGVLGNLVGSWLAYAVGRGGRLELIERHGHWLHIGPRHIAWADRWFERYGAPAIFFSRMLPIIRTFISLPAGVAKMPFLRFTALTLVGCVPWVLGLALAGEAVGSEWKNVRTGFDYVDYAVLALVVGAIVYALVRRRRGRTDTGDPAPDAAG